MILYRNSHLLSWLHWCVAHVQHQGNASATKFLCVSKRIERYVAVAVRVRAFHHCVPIHNCVMQRPSSSTALARPGVTLCPRSGPRGPPLLREVDGKGRAAEANGKVGLPVRMFVFIVSDGLWGKTAYQTLGNYMSSLSNSPHKPTSCFRNLWNFI